MTKRDTIIERNRMKSHYAVMYGKEPRNLEPVPELKERKERADKSPNSPPTERAMQRQVVRWWFENHDDFGLPKIALFMVPNGQVLKGDEIQRNIQMTSMKLEGFRNGAPDLILAVAKQGYHGLMIEMKRGKDGIISSKQHEFHHYLRNAGYWVEVPRSAEMAIAAITNYLGGTK